MYGKMLRLARLAGLVAIASPVGAADFDLINRTTIPAQLGSNGRSFVAHGVSDSGSYALFSSEASNLVTGDTNRAIDLFLHDGQLGTVERVNLGNGGTQADADTRQRADLSEDARYIVFESLATNLATGDTHGTWQVYLRDRVAQTTTLISRGTGGDGGTTGSHSPQISADGRFVVFETADSLVANDDNGVRDIYRYDRTSGTLAIVSVSASGALGNQDSDDPRISADGRYVAFHTQATNLLAGDANGDGDIVLRDTIGNLNVNASIAPGGGQFGGIRELARGNAISADGRYVLFNTDMALEAADDNAAVDGFRYDRVTQQSSCVTRRQDGAVIFVGASAEALSATGDVIVMGTRDIELAGSSSHGSLRHYTRAVPDGTIQLIKQRPGALNPYDETTARDLSGDGNKAYCTSISDALIDGDNNTMDDLFVSAIGADGGTRLSLPLPELVSAADATSSDYANGISDDGRFVAFSSAREQPRRRRHQRGLRRIPARPSRRHYTAHQPPDLRRRSALRQRRPAHHTRRPLRRVHGLPAARRANVGLGAPTDLSLRPYRRPAGAHQHRQQRRRLRQPLLRPEHFRRWRRHRIHGRFRQLRRADRTERRRARAPNVRRSQGAREPAARWRYFERRTRACESQR